MKKLNKIFTEDQVIDVANKILKKTIEKTKDELSNTFYNELENFLYEHYTNCNDKIKNNLIKEITEQFITNPDDYKFKELRDKIFYENKDKILPTLTEEAIKHCMENILLKYTHRNYMFDWQWKDGIVNIILTNWDKFKNDERISMQFGREIDRLNSRIINLQEKLNDIENNI